MVTVTALCSAVDIDNVHCVQKKTPTHIFSRPLADRTNGRAYATVLRLSVRLSVRL